jgi:hypothetical protein
MISVKWIMLPESVIVGIYPAYTHLDNGVAARETGKLCHKDRRTFESHTNARRVENGILFGMTDYFQFLVFVSENVFVVVYAASQSIKTCGQDNIIL